ncbi:hypothetical protein U6A24_12880 [Aquimarina gracilis]|uniref:Secreted protein n=1 Tax=Aquimarina gracilis TaxID=874422 RepID=A0ABU5ZWW3_9FLAO|nr:hypothetical protein [Aquimarina gracilis]MEB3346364.1 hypothetical protein [Aquimarina gracilis]
MRRVFLILTIIMTNVTLFSCTTSDLTEEIGIEEFATEGEEAEVNEVPDED